MNNNDNNNKNNTPRTREEELEMIRRLIEKMGPELEAAADKIAPDFDYDAENIAPEEPAPVTETVDAEDAAPEKAPDTLPESAADSGLSDDDEIMEKIRVLLETGNSRILDAADRIEPESDEKPVSEPAVSEPEAAKPVFEAVVHETDDAAKTAEIKTARRKRLTVLAAAALALVVLACVLGSRLLGPKTVIVRIVTFDTTREVEFETEAKTAMEAVSELLDDQEMVKQGYAYEEGDFIDVGEDARVKDGMVITVLHPVKSTIKIAGEEQPIRLVPGTVLDNLKINEIGYSDYAEITPPLEAQVNKSTKIIIK